MTEQEKLSSILNLMRKQDLSVRIRRQPNRKSQTTGIYDPGTNTVTVYSRDPDAEPQVVAGFLIHEWGHHIATCSVGFWNHTESDAWQLGQQAVPRRLLPRGFAKLKKECLHEYQVAYPDQTI